ncbi:MAG: BglII/BstYI family type II restriction endonuclease [Bacteroidota bacterium]
MLDDLINREFDFRAEQHAQAIIEADFSGALSEICETLSQVSIPIEELVSGGGGKTPVVQRMEAKLKGLDWPNHNFSLQKLVDGEAKQAISHEIDHVKWFDSGIIALEIEWNNKDPFFDRDLQNFRQLHSDGAISIGVIITRGKSFQNGIFELIRQFAIDHSFSSLEDLRPFYEPSRGQRKNINKKLESGTSFAEAWSSVFCSSKFGQSTTHWDKLEDRIDRGVGNPCPLLLFGIPLSVVVL